MTRLDATPPLGKTPGFDLDGYLAEVRARLEEALSERLPAPTEPDPLQLKRAMREAVLGGGKRLRPCLTVAACQAVGGTIDRALGAASAVEMVHCYSLVHDDLPAMDDDDFRRGRPTCHKAYGEATAILVGDGLLTLALEVLAAEGLPPEGSSRDGAGRALRACLELTRSAGIDGMVGGQAMDMTLKGTHPSFSLLEHCHMGKTAALFSASTVVGALIGGGDDEAVERLRGYGYDVGLAFQHADDVRDAEFTSYRDQAVARALELAQRATDTARTFGEAAAAPLIAIAELISRRATEKIDHEIPAQN